MSESSEYEELDSFTENLIKRTQERQRLLNDETKDVLSELSSNHSQSSLKSDVLMNDSRNNIKLNESPNNSIVDNTSKQVIENLLKISPNRKRVPLNQRLNSIAQTYNYDDSQITHYIDDDEDNQNMRPKNELRTGPAKSVTQTTITAKESPPKKRLLLNERLNNIAKSYTSDDFQSNDFNSPKEMPSTAVYNKQKAMATSRSPTKKSTLHNSVGIENKSKELEIKSTPITGSPAKKEINRNEETIRESFSPKKTKDTKNVSPVKKQIGDSFKEKLSHFGFQKTEPSVRPQFIYNSTDSEKKVLQMNTTLSTTPNVSAVRKHFEQNCKLDPKVDTPEILPVRAKTDLFEKAIIAENEAKSKQYYRKRNAPQLKPTDKPIDSLITKNRAVVSNVTTYDETAIKRQKSSENMAQTKTTVANNILLRRQELEKKLFNCETTTANAYKKELRVRHQEIELLKRPLKRDESQKYINENQKAQEPYKDKEVKHLEEEHNESYEQIDDETAQQTVCKAFEEIENYSNIHSEEESISENLNSAFDSYKSDSMIDDHKMINMNIEAHSPSKNRLYPQLFAEPNELCAQTIEPEMAAPEKPPRLCEQNTEANTTPLRTISFYRREQQKSENKTPSLQNVVIKSNVKQPNVQNIDWVERNRKIQERIDELKERVEETNRIAGQASQALNLCLERDEFKGSTERVEAEKVLLLSGQKRIVCLNEIQRLKNRLIDENPEPQTSKGLLTLSDLKLQVKGDFLVTRAKGNFSEVHHLICIVTNGGNLMPTNLLNTEDGIKNGFFEFDFGYRDMSELNSDFQMGVQIYDLVTIKHQMSHEVKYHIKKTPKKNKSTMKSPTVRSPGGPNAVMSTSFRLVGTTHINLKNYDKNCFRLDNFDFNCPLEGTLRLKSELTVRHPFNKNGFFDVRDNSGFWNMRWAVLKGSRLSFWRFPEDVTKKSPLVCIDLKDCINPKISLIPSHLRYICMRRNTIPIITVDNTNTSKNIFTKGGSIPRSHPKKQLITGENKENCIEWSEYLTTALSNIRLWDMDAVKPYSEEEFEKLMVSLQ